MATAKSKTERRRDGVLYYVTGSMGSGKTSWVKQQVARSRRLLAWDGKGIDWGARDGCTIVTDPRDLRRVLFDAGAQRISYRVPVTREAFGLFCRLAWAWGRARPGTIVVDEIADVTTPAKAPIEWGEIARKIRAYGSDVYVTTQRPQEADKTAQGNAGVYHCGRMSDSDDQKYIQRRLLGGQVPIEQVAALGPLEWIERDVRTMKVRAGKVRHG